MARSTTRRAAPAAAALTFALLAGCSGSGGLDTGAAASGSPSSAATSASPSDPAATSSVSAGSTAAATASADANAAAQADVAADYQSYDRALAKSLFTHNARVTDLIRFATAPQQAKNRSRIAKMRAQGIVYKGTPRSWIGPVSVVGNRATLHVCEKDNASWYEDASGRLVGTRLNRWNPLEVRMLKNDGRWQVNLVATSKTTSCKGAH
jgi:hypothetical protein